jgi:hypothetical protein
MDPLQMTALTPFVHNDEARSALAGAPIRPDDVVRFVRTRAVAARVLHRVADAVAPETGTARPTLAAAHR